MNDREAHDTTMKRAARARSRSKASAAKPKTKHTGSDQKRAVSSEPKAKPTNSSQNSVFDFDSYQQIHNGLESLHHKKKQSAHKRGGRSITPASTKSYSELQQPQPSSTKSHESVDYHTAARKLQDKNRRLLSEIEDLKQQKQKRSRSKGPNGSRSSDKHEFREKYQRLKDEYTRTLDELKQMKSKHIQTLKHKNQLQAHNSSLSQQVKDKRAQIRKQSEQIKAQRAEMEQMSSMSLNMTGHNGVGHSGEDSFLMHEMSSLLNLDLDLSIADGANSSLLLQKGEEKMAHLRELETKCTTIEARNKELSRQLKLAKSLKRKAESQTKSSMNSSMISIPDLNSNSKEAKSVSIPDLRVQIAELRSTKETQRKYYEKELASAKRKTQELESQMSLLSASGDVMKLQSDNASLRQKMHAQRRDVAQLRAWKCTARKKYLEQIREIRDDVQELQSRSRINQFKFGHLSHSPKQKSEDGEHSRTEHDVEVIGNNYKLILAKFNELQAELAAIIQSYSAQSGSEGGDPIASEDKKRKIYRSAMRDIERLFEVKFDENDRLSHSDTLKVIDFVTHAQDKARRQQQHVDKCDKIIRALKKQCQQSEEYKVNQNCIATLFVISSHLALELSFDDVPNHLKQIEKEAKANIERKRELEVQIAQMKETAMTEKTDSMELETRYNAALAKNEDVSRLQQDNHDLLIEMEDMKAKMMDRDEAIEAKASEIATLEAQHTELAALAEEAQQRAAMTEGLQDMIDGLEMRIENKSAECAAKERELKANRNDLKDIQQITAERDVLAQNEKERAQTISELMGVLEGTKSELAQLQRERLASLQSQETIAEKVQTISELVEVLEGTKKELAAQQTLVESRSLELAMAQRDKTTFQKLADEAMAEKTRVSDLLAQQKEMEMAATSGESVRVAVLSANVRKSQDCIAKWIELNQKLEKKVKQQQTALDEHSERDTAFEAQMKQYLTTIDALQSAEAQIVAKCAALDAELTQIRAANAQTTEAMSAQTVTMDAQRNEAVMAATQISKLRAQCESLTNELRELKMTEQQNAEAHRADMQEKMLAIAELTQTRGLDAEAHTAELKQSESDAQQKLEAAERETAELKKSLVNASDRRSECENEMESLRLSLEEQSGQQLQTERMGELKENYMELNDKYATALLELNSLKMENIHRENEVQSEFNLISASLRRSGSVDATPTHKRRSQSEHIYDLMHDEPDERAQTEQTQQSEEQSELDAYLKRLESINSQFDSRLMHIANTKQPSVPSTISPSPMEAPSEDDSFLTLY